MNIVRCPNCGNDNKSINTRCEICDELLISDKQMQNSDNSSFNIPEHIKNAKLGALKEIFDGIGTATVGAFFCVFLSTPIFHGADIISKIVLIPFLICCLSFFIHGIAKVIYGINKMKDTYNYANEKIDIDKGAKISLDENLFVRLSAFCSNIYLFGFLLFWFGVLIISDIVAIKSWSDDGSGTFFFSLFFWFIGVFIVISNFKKTNKDGEKNEEKRNEKINHR